MTYRSAYTFRFPKPELEACGLDSELKPPGWKRDDETIAIELPSALDSRLDLLLRIACSQITGHSVGDCDVARPQAQNFRLESNRALEGRGQC